MTAKVHISRQNIKRVHAKYFFPVISLIVSHLIKRGYILQFSDDEAVTKGIFFMVTMVTTPGSNFICWNCEIVAF